MAACPFLHECRACMVVGRQGSRGCINMSHTFKPLHVCKRTASAIATPFIRKYTRTPTIRHPPSCALRLLKRNSTRNTHRLATDAMPKLYPVLAKLK